MQALLGIGGAYKTKLQQKFRGTLGVGAAVADNHLSPGLGGHGGSHGSPADALHPLHKQCCAGEQCPGGAGGDESVPLPVCQELQSHNHGGILPLVDHGSRVVVHIHHIVGIGDFHALRQVVNAMLAQNSQNGLPPTHQRDLCAVGLHSFDGAQYGCLRGVVAAHCVKDNLHCATSFSRFRRQPWRRSPAGIGLRLPDFFPLFSESAVPAER